MASQRLQEIGNGKLPSPAEVPVPSSRQLEHSATLKFRRKTSLPESRLHNLSKKMKNGLDVYSESEEEENV